MNPSYYFPRHKGRFFLIATALLAGLLLSILSALEVCVEHCSANKEWELFHFSLSTIGILFFSPLVLFHLFSPHFPVFRVIIRSLLAAACGAEIVFIAIQKFAIGHWCPLCLAIAAVVAIATLLVWSTPTLPTSSPSFFWFLSARSASLTCLMAGFLGTVLGITPLQQIDSAPDVLEERLAWGNHDSPLQVYFITDWFCPSCSELEPQFPTLLSAIQSQAVICFVDQPIHRNSLNITPFHLAFALYDRPHYFKARRALHFLAATNEIPDGEKVKALASRYGLHFQELPFLEIQAGMSFFDRVVQTYDVQATPTAILYNRETNRFIKLEGLEEVTLPRILHGLEKLKTLSHAEL